MTRAVSRENEAFCDTEMKNLAVKRTRASVHFLSCNETWKLVRQDNADLSLVRHCVTHSFPRYTCLRFCGCNLHMSSVLKLVELYTLIFCKQK